MKVLYDLEKLNPEEYLRAKKKLQTYLIMEVSRFAEIAGGAVALSAMLKKDDDFVSNQLQRGSFGAIERLWKDCLLLPIIKEEVRRK